MTPRAWAKEMEARIREARAGLAWEEIARLRGLRGTRAGCAVSRSVRRWLMAEEWAELEEVRARTFRARWERAWKAGQK